MIWDIDIKIRGKIVGHWYQQFHGIPYKSYCVYPTPIQYQSTTTNLIWNAENKHCVVVVYCRLKHCLSELGRWSWWMKMRWRKSYLSSFVAQRDAFKLLRRLRSGSIARPLSTSHLFTFTAILGVIYHKKLQNEISRYVYTAASAAPPQIQ